VAASRFEKRAPTRLRFGMTMPASYRQLLIEESRLAAYQAANPADLPGELASPAWRRMSQAYLDRRDLDPVDRAGIAHWLIAVCLPDAVLDVVPQDLGADECQDPVAAVTQAARAIALFGSRGLSDRTRAAYACLTSRPAPTAVHVQSLASWGYILARHAADASAAPGLLDRATALLADITGKISEFEHGMLTTRLALRAVMHAERQGDFAAAAAQLKSAWDNLTALTPGDREDGLVLIESRRLRIDRRVEIAVRPATWLRKRRFARLRRSPCVKIHMRLARRESAAGEHEQALAQYLHAARLGPYGTASRAAAGRGGAQDGHDEFARAPTERAPRRAARRRHPRRALVAACLDAGDEPLAEVTSAPLRIRSGCMRTTGTTRCTSYFNSASRPRRACTPGCPAGRSRPPGGTSGPS
jgi:hypothetical protein